MLSRALDELGIEACCGEPSHGGPAASSGIEWDGVIVPIFGVPSSEDREVAGSGAVTVTCGDHRWTFGTPTDPQPSAAARAAADAIVPRLYCG